MKNSTITLFNAISMATSPTSNIVDLSQIYCCSIQFIVTGTPGGTLSIFGSNDPVDKAAKTAPTNFSLIGTATTLATADGMINLDGQGYRWLRVAFATGGSGTLTVNFFGKG